MKNKTRFPKAYANFVKNDGITRHYEDCGDRIRNAYVSIVPNAAHKYDDSKAPFLVQCSFECWTGAIALPVFFDEDVWSFDKAVEVARDMSRGWGIA